MCEKGIISEEDCQRDDVLLEKCYTEVESFITGLKRSICRGERIEGHCGRSCIKNIQEKENRGEELSFLDKSRLKAYSQNKNTVYDVCNLPDEISYQIFIKEHDEKNKCFDRWLEKLRKED